MGKLGIIFIVASIFIAFSVLAIPGIPHQIYGTVTINNAPASDSTVVSAKIGGDTYQTTTTGGRFGYDPSTFFVEEPDGGTTRDGKTIEIFVNNKKVTEVIFENNGYTKLDLASTEESSSSGGSSGSGGGSSGGGGGSSGSSSGSVSISKNNICVEKWECDEWTECSKGKQIRDCNDLNKCGTNILEPEERKDCVDEVTGEIKEDSGSSSRITGAFAAIASKIKNPIFIVVILLALALIVIFAMKKRNKNS